MTLLRKKENTNGLAASVTDGYLILSLPHAIEPVVWRQSLEKIGSALFEIKLGEEDSYNLILKKTKTSSDVIASFEEKEQAIEALNAASSALHSKKTIRNIIPEKKNTAPQVESDETSSQNSKGEGQKWIIALLAAIIVIGLYYYLTTLIPERTVGVGVQNQAQPSNGPVSDPSSAGVPVSADDFLNSLQ